MGGVAVLHPQDLFNRDNLLSPAMKTHSLGRNPLSRPPAPQGVNRSSRRRKRSPQKSTSNNHNPATKPTSNSNPPLMMGQVKILKRGETLPIGTPLSSENLKVEEKKQQVPKTNNSKKKSGALAAGFSQKQIRISGDCYAGSAYISSPPPSSLPVPGFFKKKHIVLTDDNNSSGSNSNEDATNDLLKLLRLDLS